MCSETYLFRNEHILDKKANICVNQYWFRRGEGVHALPVFWKLFLKKRRKKRLISQCIVINGKTSCNFPVSRRVDGTWRWQPIWRVSLVQWFSLVKMSSQNSTYRKPYKVLLQKGLKGLSFTRQDVFRCTLESSHPTPLLSESPPPPPNPFQDVCGLSCNFA